VLAASWAIIDVRAARLLASDSDLSTLELLT
jgi:hypothetical protein